MHLTKEFREQHKEIKLLCKHLIECSVEQHIALNASYVHKIQKDLERLLSLHLRLEDNSLYPVLRENKSQLIRETSLRLQKEFSPCADWHNTYQEKYSTQERIQSSPRAYVQDTQRIVQQIQKRIDTEEDELYVLLR